jgi:hypothetical protein
MSVGDAAIIETTSGFRRAFTLVSRRALQLVVPQNQDQMHEAVLLEMCDFDGWRAQPVLTAFGESTLQEKQDSTGHVA